MKDLTFEKGFIATEEKTHYPIFTEETVSNMLLKTIPDFGSLHRSISAITTPLGPPFSAINFLPALRQFSLNDYEIEQVLNNDDQKFVLAQNDIMKIVMIKWEPGALCEIHGHPIGGCVFKVLHGQITENRYSTNHARQLLSTNRYHKDHIAYIDDIMGFHNVGNENNTTAITLHLYTPGNYKGIGK